MARGINKVILVGNLGQDPESRSFPDGGTVTRVSIATTEEWKNRQTGNQETRTEWHEVVFRNRLAEVAAQYLRKGSKIYVEGSLRTRKWTNQQGQDQYTTEIHAREMQMLDSRGDDQGGGYQQHPPAAAPSPQQNFQQSAPAPAPAPASAPAPAPAPPPAGFDDFDDDIPF